MTDRARVVAFQGIQPNSDLTILGADLRRVRSRCLRLHRQSQADPAAWERWSKADDEQSALFDRIALTPITTIADIASRYEAVAMDLLDGDLILDEAARRRVAKLRRDLRQLARSPP